MSDETGLSAEAFLTEAELVRRYRGAVSEGTLKNWRGRRYGPNYVKIGRSVLYPLRAVEAWERENMISCRSS